MAAVTADAMFSKQANVEIQKIDSAVYFNATVDIDSFTESGFEREVEYRSYFGGAKIGIEKTQNDGELTMNVKVRRADWDSILHGGSVDSDGLGAIEAGGDQDNYRIIFLVSNDPAVTEARDAVATGSDTYRKIYAECKATSFTPGLEADGLIEGEIVFAVSPIDDTSASNIRIDFSNTGLAAVSDYTTIYKYPAV